MTLKKDFLSTWRKGLTQKITPLTSQYGNEAITLTIASWARTNRTLHNKRLLGNHSKNIPETKYIRHWKLLRCLSIKNLTWTVWNVLNFFETWMPNWRKYLPIQKTTNLLYQTLQRMESYQGVFQKTSLQGRRYAKAVDL